MNAYERHTRIIKLTHELLREVTACGLGDAAHKEAFASAVSIVLLTGTHLGLDVSSLADSLMKATEQ